MKGLQRVPAIALLFGLASSAGIIILVQFLIPEVVKILPLAVGLIAFMVVVKRRVPTARFSELFRGAVLLVFITITILYGYVVIFHWMSPSQNPLSQSVPILDHAITLMIILVVGSGVGALLAIIFSSGWMPFKRAL